MVGTCAYSGLVQAAVWQKPTQHGKEIIFQLKILKTQAACCPILANPPVEKQERSEARHLSSRRCAFGESMHRPHSAGPVFIPEDRGARGVHAAGSTRPPGRDASACGQHPPLAPCLPPALLSRCTRSTHTRNRLSLQLKAFFWIFSLVHISTVGSACDNIINILIPSWFFSRLPWRGKKTHNQAFQNPSYAQNKEDHPYY